MAIPDRPDGYPIHAANWTSADNLKPVVESLFRFSGNEKNTPVKSDDINGKLQSTGFWIAHTDCLTIKNGDWLDTTTDAQLSVDKLRYVVGNSVTLAPGADVDTRTVVLIQGRRIETDITLLRIPVAEPLYAPGVPTPGRVWVYVNKEGVVRLENVAAAVVDSPDVGNDEIALVGVDIDGAGNISGHTDPITLPLPPHALPVLIPIAFDTASFNDLAVKQLTAGDGTGAPIIVAVTPAGFIGLNITGAGNTFAAKIDGVAHSALATTNSSAETTLVAAQVGTGRAALLQNSDATSCTLKVEQGGDGCAIEADAAGAGPAVQGTNTDDGSGGEFLNSDATAGALTCTNASTGPSLDVVGDAKISGVATVLDKLVSTNGAEGPASAPFALPEGATVPDNKTIVMGADTTVSGGANSTCGPWSVVSGSTIDTGSSFGIVKPGRIEMYVDATPATTDGAVQYDGLRWSLGGDSVARPFYAPAVEYVVSDTTINSIDDISGLTVTLNIPPTREVLIELFAKQSSDTAVEDVRLEISAENAGAADTVTRLKDTDDDQALSILPTVVTANDTSPNSIEIVWSPDDDVVAPVNDTWTIKARHGISGGATLVTTNCTLRVTYR